MAGYCTLVLYFHSPAARENAAAHLYNIQPYYLLTHQIIYIYIHVPYRQLKHATSHATFFPQANGLDEHYNQSLQTCW